MIRRLLEEVPLISGWLVNGFPGRTGKLLRLLLFKVRAKESSWRVSIDTGVEITGPENIQVGDNVGIVRMSGLYAHGGKLEIGSNVTINQNCQIGASEGGHIVIGNNVMIGPNVVIRASDHVFTDLHKPMREQGHTGGTIIIEDDVWIGASAVITANTRLGTHSVVGAGAVVTQDVPANSVVGGVPARVLKTLTRDQEFSSG